MTVDIQKSPTWLRIIQFVMGGIAITLSIYRLLNPITAAESFLSSIAISLLAVGISGIINGILKMTSKGARVIVVCIGIIAIIGGLFAIVRPFAQLFSEIQAISLFVLIYGIGLTATGVALRNKGKSVRISKIVIGIIVAILAGLLLEYPRLSLTITVFLLSIGLLINGIDIVITGAAGNRIIRRH